MSPKVFASDKKSVQGLPIRHEASFLWEEHLSLKDENSWSIAKFDSFFPLEACLKIGLHALVKAHSRMHWFRHEFLFGKLIMMMCLCLPAEEDWSTHWISCQKSAGVDLLTVLLVGWRELAPVGILCQPNLWMNLKTEWPIRFQKVLPICNTMSHLTECGTDTALSLFSGNFVFDNSLSSKIGTPSEFSFAELSSHLESAFCFVSWTRGIPLQASFGTDSSFQDDSYSQHGLCKVRQSKPKPPQRCPAQLRDWLLKCLGRSWGWE